MENELIISAANVVEDIESYHKKFKESIDSKMLELSIHYKLEESFKRYNNLPNLFLKNTYYRYLTAYSISKKPRWVLELGSQTGSGAVALGANQLTHVTLCDVDTSFISEEIKQSSKFTVIKSESRERCLSLLDNKYDAIFVDIDHVGDLELDIHYNLKEMKYKGIVFWDDIKISNKMNDFWHRIKSDKDTSDAFDHCTVSQWHPEDFAGFGVTVYYGG
jgi:predicted O-methyltransferase YrrM